MRYHKTIDMWLTLLRPNDFIDDMIGICVVGGKFCMYYIIISFICPSSSAKFYPGELVNLFKSELSSNEFKTICAMELRMHKLSERMNNQTKSRFER